MKDAQKIINTMMEKDFFSKWLGIKILEIGEGTVTAEMTVTKEMLNGFSIAHGGITYSFADSLLAFSSNMEGYQAVSVETSISHLKKVSEGQKLVAFAKKIHRSKKIGLYEVKIENELEEIVAIFKGTMYISDRKWLH